MKKTYRLNLIVVALLLITSGTYGQINCNCLTSKGKERATCIGRFDSEVHFNIEFLNRTGQGFKDRDSTAIKNSELDHKLMIPEKLGDATKEQKQQIRDTAASAIGSNIDNLLCLLRLRDGGALPDSVQYLLDFVVYPETALRLYKKFEIEVAKANPTPDNYLSGMKRNLELLRKHLNSLVEQNFVQYNYATSKLQVVKGLHISTVNDVFTWWGNEDRNLTGGLRIEMATDILRLQFRTIAQINAWAEKRKAKKTNLANKLLYGVTKMLQNDAEDFLDYQSLLWGFEVYTPNLRDVSIFSNPYSYDPLDRPYGSFQWFGFAKNKLNYRGVYRKRAELKLGLIGGNISKGFQSMLHQDLTVNSVKPNGWEAQVANGGRFAIQFDHKWDIMMRSATPTLLNRRYAKPNQRKPWFNLYIPTAMHVGAALSGLDAGLGFTTQNFTKLSAYNEPDAGPLGNITVNFTAELSYRYVLHNSMLEGFGYFKTEPDEEFLKDDFETATSKNKKVYTEAELEAVGGTGRDIYVLDADHVVRNLLLANVGVSVRSGRMTINLAYSGISREFNFPGAKSDPWHEWGTLGINYIF
jgi:hypothetical protein